MEGERKGQQRKSGAAGGRRKGQGGAKCRSPRLCRDGGRRPSFVPAAVFFFADRNCRSGASAGAVLCRTFCGARSVRGGPGGGLEHAGAGTGKGAGKVSGPFAVRICQVKRKRLFLKDCACACRDGASCRLSVPAGGRPLRRQAARRHRGLSRRAGESFSPRAAFWGHGVRPVLRRCPS